MSERHGASRRWRSEPAASALPLTTPILSLDAALSDIPEGAVQGQPYHRELLKGAVDLLRQEIKRITGVAVAEAAAEIGTLHAQAQGVCPS